MVSYSQALFISDLHLFSDRKKCIDAFLKFLEWIPNTTEALFILGDFFEYWVGDDLSSPLSKEISYNLKKTSEQKEIQIFFVPGNRDFALGKQYCQQCSMTLLSDNHVFMINNQKILVCHGDLLCTDDVGYQRFRRFIRHPIILNSLRKLPLFIRLKLARYLRNKSKQKFSKQAYYVDVNQQAVTQLFSQSDADIIIHGHTHLANIHRHESNRRMVLGDWHHIGWYGVCDQLGLHLNSFDVDNPDFQNPSKTLKCLKNTTKTGKSSP